MHFDLSEEQHLLQQTVQRFLADRYSFEQRTEFLKERQGWRRELWRQFAELGLLGVTFDPDDGGYGGGSVELMLVQESLGAALALEPFLSTVILAGGLLKRGGTAAQRAQYLPRIASGDLLAAFAHAETQARYELTHVELTARKEGGQWVLNGLKTNVLHGDCADLLVVSARIEGERHDQHGLALFLVDGDQHGVSRVAHGTQDDRRVGQISFDNVCVGADKVLGEPGKAYTLIERTVDDAIIAIAAEAVGAMGSMQEMTVQYLKDRQQFGVPIGSFQVLQHRAVDMQIALEQARSMAVLAAMTDDDNMDRDERQRTLSAVKVQIGRSARFIAQQAVQLHGAIALTDEYSLGHYFKRLTVLDLMFGDADHHLSRLATLGGLYGAWPEDSRHTTSNPVAITQ